MKAPKLHSKLSHLILSHYDLASTTVTGIPMKEEQNASSSANYDVEIFHASAAHSAIMKGNLITSLKNLFHYYLISFCFVFRQSARICFDKNVHEARRGI